MPLRLKFNAYCGSITCSLLYKGVGAVWSLSLTNYGDIILQCRTGEYILIICNGRLFCDSQNVTYVCLACADTAEDWAP